MTNGIRNPHLPSGCCIPFRRAWPSGISWTHDRKCSEHPNEKFAPGEPALLKLHNREHIKERHEARQNPVAATELHSACRLAASEGKTPCGACSWLLGLENAGSDYTDSHVDDEVETR